MMELVERFHISEDVFSFVSIGKLLISNIKVVLDQVSQVTHVICLTLQQVLHQLPVENKHP